jgi:hypothetical protein
MSIIGWTNEWKERLRSWENLSEQERSLIGTSAMNELVNIIQLGVEKTRLKLENR